MRREKGFSQAHPCRLQLESSDAYSMTCENLAEMISACVPVGMDLVANKSGMLCLEKSVLATVVCGITIRACLGWLRSSQDYP